MKKPSLGGILYAASGIWLIVIGLNILFGFGKGLRK